MGKRREMTDRTSGKLNHPAIINNPDPSKKDHLDCAVVETLDLDELKQLQLMLGRCTVAFMRVQMQIDLLKFSGSTGIGACFFSRIKNDIKNMESCFRGNIFITNVDLDTVGSKSKKIVH